MIINQRTRFKDGSVRWVMQRGFPCGTVVTQRVYATGDLLRDSAVGRDYFAHMLRRARASLRGA